MTDPDTPPHGPTSPKRSAAEPPRDASAVAIPERPAVDVEALPFVPRPDVLLKTLVVVVWAALGYVLLQGVSRLFLDLWFLESLGLESVFWTNVRAGAVLFAVASLAFAAVIYLPLRRYAVSPVVRRYGAHVAAWTGLGAGWLLAGRYQEFLLAFSGGRFGVADPYFGHDIGFYVFVLPALWTTLWAATFLTVVGLVASLVAQADRLRQERSLLNEEVALPVRVGRLLTPTALAFVGAFGLLLSVEALLTRYEVLWKDNTASGVLTGAEYIDVGSLFSTVNALHVTAFVVFAITLLAVNRLYGLHVDATRRVHRVGRGSRHIRAPDGGDERTGRLSRHVPFDLRGMTSMAVVGLIVLDLAFVGGIVLMDDMAVRPNEPTVQDRYMQEHMDATLTGYGLNDVEVVEWSQPASNEPRDLEALLESRTLQQAPLWPGWVSYLDAPMDPSQVDRVRKTGTTMVYGPVLVNYQQEQQLRPYYWFADVDTVRYTVDDETRMYTTSVREQPTIEAIGEKEWLQHWTTSRFQYTHGLGVVMSPANEVNPDGSLPYVVKGIPPESDHPELVAPSRIYYGEMFNDEGQFNYAFTNAHGLSEFDFAQAEDRQEFTYPADGGGISVDSHLKEAVLSFTTGDWDILFSEFIDHDKTRVHYYRTPTERVKRAAPFLFVDCNAYAVSADGRTTWMVNGLTTTDRYPNSFRDVLGDKAEERCPVRGETRTINYAEDSVKMTIDATTGELTVYKFADGPIVDAWASVYPDLFTPGSAMSDDVESHLQYPMQWMHLQLDDVWYRYHQTDVIEFYNNEDLWDDGDEVRGSIVGDRKEIIFSYEPLDILVDPADLPGSAREEDASMQFVKVKPFTPENSNNLRSAVLVYQDPGGYGRVVDLRIPQGAFVHSPEQADSLLDQNDDITSKINLWERTGSEVIRGHTIILPVDGDLLYLEPIFVKSLQAEQPEIRMVVAMYHREIGYGPTPEAAVENLAEKLAAKNATTEGDTDA